MKCEHNWVTYTPSKGVSFLVHHSSDEQEIHQICANCYKKRRGIRRTEWQWVGDDK